MTPLPRGTVTFLFTDIEGSTRRWERDATAMRAAVDRHLALLGAAVAAQGGQGFKVVGDALQAAFGTAAGAVAAAVAAQRALLAEDWERFGPDTAGLRVRMALHTGAAEPENGDYLAPCLNRLARLLATAHGGQVLLSQATAQLARAELPPGIALRDLGPHRLRDLLEPEHVFQLSGPGLPADFPALRSLDRHPNNLPLAMTPIIGREGELASAAALILRPDVRLVTLTGPGGVGKTRFALQLAADLVDDFPDGVYLVPLAPVTEPGLVVSAIAAALGVRETGGLALAQGLMEALGAKTLLLVLDNFEHVVEAAPTVSELLSACPSLKVLVTSRELLRLRGEHELPVPPLGLPSATPGGEMAPVSQYAAVELFIRRAQEVKPDFQVSNETAPAIAEICARLDGLPLAIELAAARVKLFGPRQLLDRLTGTAGAQEGRALPLLTGGARDAPERQRTLRAAIAWSHELLQPDEQVLFRRLASFSGGWSLELAEAVCRGGPEGPLPALGGEVVDGLGSLIDKNLVRHAAPASGEARFDMLRTIEEFASAELLDSGEEPATRAAHLAAYRALAETAVGHLTGAEQVAWLEKLQVEHDNLRQAIAWGTAEAPLGALALATAMWRFWFMRGHFGEGRARLEAALAAAGEQAPGAARSAALNGLGVMAWAQADYEAANRALSAALALRRAAGDRQGLAGTLSNLGAVSFERGDLAAARRMHEEALAIRRELDDRWGLSASLLHLANVEREVGDYASAEARSQEALALARELGDRSGVAFALGALAKLAVLRGDFALAEALATEALAAAEALDDPDARGRSHTQLGLVARERGDHAAAREHFERALAIRRDLGDRRGMAEVLRELGNVAVQEGDPERGRQHYGEALDHARAVGDRDGVARTLNNLAIVARAAGDGESARRLLDESLAEWRDLGSRHGEARVLDNLGMVAFEAGDLDAAADHYQESLRLRRDLGDRRGAASGLEGVGLLAAARGEVPTAARLWAAAATLRAALGAPLPASERERFGAGLEQARALDPAAFRAAWAGGEGLAWEAAVDEALALLEAGRGSPRRPVR